MKRENLLQMLAAVLMLGLAGQPTWAGTDIVAAGAEVKKLTGGFRFTEGPVADANGNVFFSDIPNRKIHKWSSDEKLTMHRSDSGGANGLYFDPNGNLIACEMAARRVTSMDKKGKITVLVDKYNGKKFNSPNDLWIDPKGGIYFSDPRYGRGPKIEQDGMHVYYLPPDHRGKEPIRVTNNLVKPNGLIGTADGKRLYIADPGSNKTYVYRILPDGRLADKTLFVKQGSDGMTLDAEGNVYLTDKGLSVYDPGGKLIRRIRVPERPSNMTFGGIDRKTLFITARRSLYSIRMAVEGVRAPIKRTTIMEGKAGTGSPDVKKEARGD